MSVKSEFVCSICVKVLKKPVTFTCGCTVCGEHLHDKEVKKTNKIVCIPCKIEYNLNEIEFKINILVEKMLGQGVHLTKEEKDFKLHIGQSIAENHRLANEAREKKSSLEVDIYDHFVEVRRGLDIRREEAKAQIDIIYMQMINMAKETEARYIDYLKATLVQSVLSDSLDKERNALEEKFRDPHLKVESVKEMKAKQDEAIGDLNHKIREFGKVKEFVKENVFKAGNPLDKVLFGELKLVQSSESLNKSQRSFEKQSTIWGTTIKIKNVIKIK